MAEQNPAVFLQAGSHPAEDLRRFVSSVMGDRPGIVGSGDLAVTQTGTPSMGVSVAAGRAFVKGTEGAYQGLYFVEERGAKTLAIAPADATNARYDLVVARVRDASYSGSTNAWALEVVTGTASATPAEPTVPANSLVLARITVAKSVSSITNAAIQDRRLTTSGQSMASGLRGVLVTTAAFLPASGDFLGQEAFETDTGYVRRWDGTRWRYAGDRVVVADTAARDALSAYVGLRAIDGTGRQWTFTAGTPNAWRDYYPVAFLRATSAQTAIPSGWSALRFHVADVDSHGGWSSTPNPSRWTVPAGQGGVYAVEGGMTVNNPQAGMINAGIYKNGAPHASAWAGANTFPAGLLSGVGTGRKLLNLVPGDYVEVWGFYGPGAWNTYVDATVGPWLAVERIR